MKLRTKMMLGSALTFSILGVSQANAQEVSEFWSPRSVDDIKSQMSSSLPDTYTVQYGDTLSVIAKAFNIDMSQLVNINGISDVNKIYPNTVLSLQYGANVSSDKTIQSVEDGSQDINSDKIGLATETFTSEYKDLVENENITIPNVNVSEDFKEDSNQMISDSVSNETESNLNTELSNDVRIDEHENDTFNPESESEVEKVDSDIDESIQDERNFYGEEEIDDNSVKEEANLEDTSEQSTTDTTVINYDNSGLQPQVAAYKEEVANLFGITEFSGYREGDTQDHGKGLAIDFMVPVSSTLGDQVAEYATSNMTNKGISYVIWKQRFYSPYPSIYGPAYTWNPMPDRGSVTENHYDHVHVSFNG